MVGEIEEDRPVSRPVWTDAAGRVRAAGTARLDEVGGHVGFALDHPDVETVSGSQEQAR